MNEQKTSGSKVFKQGTSVQGTQARLQGAKVQGKGEHSLAVRSPAGINGADVETPWV